MESPVSPREYRSRDRSGHRLLDRCLRASFILHGARRLHRLLPNRHALSPRNPTRQAIPAAPSPGEIMLSAKRVVKVCVAPRTQVTPDGRSVDQHPRFVIGRLSSRQAPSAWREHLQHSLLGRMNGIFFALSAYKNHNSLINILRAEQTHVRASRGASSSTAQADGISRRARPPHHPDQPTPNLLLPPMDRITGAGDSPRSP